MPILHLTTLIHAPVERVFDYTSPLGLLGCMADAFVLKRYMERLLGERNQMIKAVAESAQWQKFLPVPYS